MLRWSILAIATIIILIFRTINYGFFHGKDWLLYLILFISISFAFYYKNHKNQENKTN